MGPRNQTLCQPGKPYHDYGCQYFTASDSDFAAEVARWASVGLCQALPESSVGTLSGKEGFRGFAGQKCWVGNGGMAPMMFSLVKQTSDEFKDVLEHVPGFPDEAHKVQTLSRSSAGWTLTTRSGRALGPFDVVIGAFAQHCLTDPFLLSGGAASADMLACLRRVEFNQIIAMQVIFEGEPIDAGFPAAHVVGEEDLSFVSNNSRKPQQSGSLGTPGPQHWTLLSTAGFAERELSCNPQGYRRSAEKRMLAAFSRVLGGCDLARHRPRIQRINHWEDGLPVNTPPGGRSCLLDVKQSIGWCGDFCVAPCVQGAWQSGSPMAREIAAYRTDPKGYSAAGMLPGRDESREALEAPEGSFAGRDESWEALEAMPDSTRVDIGAFPSLQGLLPQASTHTDLVPSAVGGYQKEAAHFGAAGKAAKKGGGKGPYGGPGESRGKGKGRGKGKAYAN